MLEESVNQTEELRINEVVRLKYILEKESWTKKIFLKFVEAFAFAGIFLCTNPLGFKICVIVSVVAVLLDVLLSYSDWEKEWNFKRITL